MKEEPENGESDGEHYGRVVEVDIANIYNLQQGCSNKFRNGYDLRDLIADLKSKVRDPLKNDWLILNVAKGGGSARVLL